MEAVPYCWINDFHAELKRIIWGCAEYSACRHRSGPALP